jgi:AcrR family transcriptional regulator
LQRSQAVRRARAIDAVLALAEEGGYDAVQLRAVSERSGVGTRTIYDYFGSRDALLSAAVGEWLDREILEPAPRRVTGDTAAEQLLSVGRHVWDVWERNPRMLEVFVRTALAEGPREDVLSKKGIRAFFPVPQDLLTPVDPDYARDVLMMLNTLTHSLMVSTVVGWIAPGVAFDMLERAIRRVAQHPAMRQHRPKAWSFAGRP